MFLTIFFDEINELLTTTLAVVTGSNIASNDQCMRYYKHDGKGCANWLVFNNKNQQWTQIMKIL